MVFKILIGVAAVVVLFPIVAISALFVNPKNGTVDIAFCGNTDRTKRNNEFFSYLLDWK